MLDTGDLVVDDFPSLYADVVKYGVRNSQSGGPMTKQYTQGNECLITTKRSCLWNNNNKQMCSSGNYR